MNATPPPLPSPPSPPRTIWPAVLGVSSAVIAFLLGLANAVRLSEAPSFRPRSGGAFYITDAVEIALIVLLFLAGRFLAKRTMTGAVLHWVYIAMQGVCSVVTIWWTAGMAGIGAAVQDSAAVGAMIWMGSIVRLLPSILALAYCFFLAVWFSRPAIRREIASWRRA